jgi:hypothetical protein
VGAAAATGPLLLFLHADTCLPEGFDRTIRQTLAQPGVVAGAFRLAIDGPGRGLRWVEWGVNLRSRLLQMPYGDQAIFLKAEVFHHLGGFPDLPMMEDFELVRRLRKWEGWRSPLRRGDERSALAHPRHSPYHPGESGYDCRLPTRR